MRKSSKRSSKRIREIALYSLLIVFAVLSVAIYTMQLQVVQKINIAQYGINALTENGKLQSEIYTIEDGYISRILPETTLRDLKNNLDEENISVYKKTGELLQDNDFVGTGMNLKISGKEYKLSVIGDLTGNGKIGITDLTQLKLFSVGLGPQLVDEYKKSGDINNSGNITITDVTKENLALVNLIDVKAPNSFVPEVKSTKDSITVKGETSDSGSGVKEYWFELNNNGWVQNKNNEYTFTDLTLETNYTVRMKVVDNEGNAKITKRVEIATLNEENANISIVTNTEDWTNEDVQVAVNYNSNVSKETKQISIDNGITWNDYKGPVKVEKNTVIKARVLNSNGIVLEEEEKTISNIDKLAPKAFDLTVEVGDNNIKVNAQTDDAEETNEYGKSGIKSYKYILINGIWNWEEETTETTYTFENLVKAMQYKIKVIAIDNAGNKYETEIISNTTAGASTLEIDPNGGEWEGSNLLKKFPNDLGETKTISDPVRVGYVFKGWTLTGEGTLENKIYTYGKEDGKITAEWIPITYTVNYNGNGATTGSTISSVHVYDTSKTLTANGYRKTYTVTYETNGGTSVSDGIAESKFSGWSSSENGVKEYYDEQAVRNLTSTDKETIELYALWENATITLPESTKNEYILEGWYTDSTLKTKAGNAGENYTISTEENITLYAKFERAIYAKVYTDGTLTLSSTNETLTTKTLEEDYGNVYKAMCKKDFEHPWSNNIQSVDILNKIQAPETANWFSNCKNLKTINNIENIDTSEVWFMNGMFYNCTGLTNIDLSNFNTKEVKETINMFSNCTGLITLDISNFNISNMEDFSYMFAGCSELTDIKLPMGTTAKYCFTEYMFYGCSKLTILDLSNISGEFAYLDSMFENCNNLETIKIMKLTNEKTISMESMFKNCNSLVSLDMSEFELCECGTSSMFYGCSSLVSLNLSNLDVERGATDSMFYGCSSLTELNISSLSSSLDCSNMFYGCSQLKTLDISALRGGNAYRNMFYGCSSLTVLDLSNLYVSGTTDMHSMFYGCTSLTKILVGSNWNTSSCNTTNMFGGNCGVSEVTKI